jgi:hypothetical protein
VYHNIHIQTSFNYIKDYNLFNWPVLSLDDRQKVITFNIEPRRSCDYIISSTGTINMSIECTLQPFHLHDSIGLVEFFVFCRKIIMMLQLATTNRINVVSPIEEWLVPSEI